MIRYFMTVREACDLVLTAAAHAVDESDAGRASVYVLKMGQPVRIADLADRMIRLSGLEPGRDIDVVETGMRPGERLHEILFDQDETMVETRIDGIMAARTPAAKREDLTQWLGQLRDAVATGDAAAAEAVLRIAIPEYRPNGGGGPSA
jgi:O-antigen biosynthesis protein WbqV